MTAVQREYLLKGVFLGLWVMVALARPPADALLRAVGLTAAGLGVGLILGVGRLFARGHRPRRPGFLLLALLDHPLPATLGLIGGVVAAAVGLPDPARGWLVYGVAGGAVAGLGLFFLDRLRFTLPGRLAAAVVILAPALLAYDGFGGPLKEWATADRQAFGLTLLCGLPFYWLLGFAGDADKSTADADVLFSGLFAGVSFLRPAGGWVGVGDVVILFIVLLLLWAGYVGVVMPRLRVYRHVLRGYGAVAAGRTRDALTALGRALHLDPRSSAAAAGLRRLHADLNPADLDATTLPLLNFGLVLDRAEALLVQTRPPTAGERGQAARLLDLTDAHRPPLAPRTDYLRAVALTHAGEFDAAAAVLGKLLDPATDYPDRRPRDGVLLRAWDLATRVHPQLVRRLGEAELTKPGRRLDALAAVEKHLATMPDDPAAVGFRRELYAGLTEGEVAAGPTAGLNFDHLEQLGLSLVEAPAEVERGMTFLRMAGRGLPAHGPVLFRTLADLATKLGRSDEAAGYLGQVKRAGLETGIPALAPDQRAAYTAAVKELAELATTQGDFAAAADAFRLYVEAAGEDPAKLKALADLYAKSPDPMGVLNALAVTERALLYAKADPELLARKESLYFSVSPAAVAEKRDKVAGWFDVAHCVKRATAVAGQKDADLDALDYGLHLARLARLLQPHSNAVRFAEGRLMLRTGEREAGLALLEDVRESPRGGGDEEDAWFLATRLLGDLYLDELQRPDLAVLCFRDFRGFQRSGADTLYRLGQAHEAAGDSRAAVAAYKAVTAYSGHPRYWDADAAVKRLTNPPT